MPARQLLSDIPNQSERSLSHFRTPMREDATGPRPAIPARLSPPPPSRRSHIQSLSSATNGATKSSRPVEDKSSSRSCYDSKPIYQLPIHAGPPSSRSSYSPSTLNPPPASPYSTTSTDTRWEYSSSSSRDSHSLPAPPTPYSSLSSSRSSSYAPSGNYRKGDPVYGGQYPGDAPGRDARSAGMPAYQQLHPSYQSVQYGYPPPPPPPNGNYAVSHHCQSGYHNGSTQFESDESGGHAPRRRRGNLPRDTTDMLKQWFADHLAHPYPTEDEKQMLCRQTGLQMTQVSQCIHDTLFDRSVPETNTLPRSAIGSSMPGGDESQN